ncbi:MAG: dihydroorotate dehydrogenase [Patescibacteria group bacterium]|nr:dihydroorotate dehydrogenase [Patescibacteria group bacterium]
MASSNGVNLTVNIGDIELKNPVMPASGTFGYGKEFTDLVDLNTLGAIITKGITLEPRDGADQPRLCEIPQGMINRIGLQNPGVKKFVAEKMPFLRTLKPPIIVNICGSTVEEYQKLAKILDVVEGIAAIEINISCPNTERGGMAFGQNPRTAFEVVSAVREATSLPLITKLTPAVASIVQIAEAAAEAGTNALSAINTIPALGFVNGKIILGGQSGPSIKPIALRFIYELARAKLGVPLIGCGGIMTWQDAVEFLIVGAQAVEIGTATFTNSKTMEEVIKGLENYLQEQGIKDINEIIGTALS